LFRADEDLCALALALGEETREIDDWLARTRRVFDARFWDDARGMYLDYDVRTRTPIPVSTCAAFMPLFAGLASEAQTARLVAEHLNNPAEYAPGADSKYRLPSASKLERDYSPRRYWCGPVWINMNWLIADGLRRYGFDALAQELDADSLVLMQQSGFREYYDPRDGTGCGATQFSWSAALAIEILKG
jgi:neutral trehalase